MSRPSDVFPSGFEPEEPVRSPRLGPIEWLRWAWRQLTSMRTALLLLLALAVAAVPGSLIPQNSSDPNGVVQWRQQNPSLVSLVNAVQGFDVYTSAWFSAIYLLLFVSLVGCVVPRVRHHLQALRAAPPRTPARLERLPAHQRVVLRGEVDPALAAAEAILRRRRYRVRRYGASVSAERGYLRETGNLVFHLGLVGILIAVFVGGGFTYTGQRILVTGQTFVNAQSNYDSLNPGRFFSSGALQPYSLKLQHLAVRYETHNVNAIGEAIDYTATVGVVQPDGTEQTQTIKVNDPLEIGGTSVYLLGNGYAPKITVRDASGKPVFSDWVPFIPKDTSLTSFGVVKVSNLPKAQQLGLQGFFYPTAEKLTSGAYTSTYPDLVLPLLTLSVYQGDLKLGTAAGSNAFALDTDGMRGIAGPTKDFAAKPLQLKPGQTAQLPKGLGSVRFDGVTRFASLDIHHDPSQGWVAGFVALVVAGLITSLLVPRRRMWVAVRAGDADSELVLEYAALARGDDPGLERAVAELAEEHARAVAQQTPAPAPRIPAGV